MTAEIEAPEARIVGPLAPDHPERRWARTQPSRLASRTRRVLLALGVLTSVVVVALGFVFSQSVLAVAHPGARTFAVTLQSVTELPDGTLTVAFADEDQDGLLAEVGLATSGGYGRLLGEPQVTSGIVTRSYVHVRGALPTSGDLADLDAYAWPDDLAAFGLVTGVPVEAVDVADPDSAPSGPLGAWLVGGRSEQVLLYVHGRGATRAEGLRLARIAADAGWSTLLVSHRGDGIAADPEPAVGGFGTVEWPDLTPAMTWLEDNGARSVVLAGSSQGAMTAGLWWENVGRAAADAGSPVVVGALFDSPLVSLQATLRQAAANQGIPRLLARPILAATKGWSSVLGGFDAAAAELLARTEDWELPTLLVHGANDDQVPWAIGNEWAAQGPQTTLATFSAGHVRSYNVQPNAYRDAVVAFLDSLSR